MGNSSELPDLDKTLKIYYSQTFQNTFPASDFTTMFVAWCHIIGVYFLYFGWLLPPRYIWVYLVFTTILLFSYAIFDMDCYMTLLANLDTNFNGSALMVSKETATSFIIVALFISIIIINYPNYAPFNIIKNTILSLS